MNPNPMFGSSGRNRSFLWSLLLMVATAGAAEKWVVTGWNNLGMHCMDADYSVFSILPPHNTLHAQVIRSVGTTSTDMVTTLMTGADGIRVTYEAVADPSGSINRTSIGKTNFWTYAQVLYGTALPLDKGLTGASMPGTSNTPQRFTWDASNDCFTADGIPIVPKDDAGKKNFYPMMRLKAYDAGNVLRAQTDVVVPVSDEMDCRSCHGSNAKLGDAMPDGGWVNDPNPERDYRLNILKKHDDVLLGTSLYQESLAARSYREDGLFKTVTVDAKPILCAACHSSNALPGTGYTGVSPLTQALHSTHARVVDPDNGLTLGSAKNRSSCYQCHPGSDTNCLRGAMGSAVAADGSMQMQCQSCHGSMMQVGAPNRAGWLDEPTCQQCHTGTAVHNNGQIRYTSVYEPSGQARVAVNQTFATNPNSPVAGKSLYRTSSGHGGMKCQACHGSTHAEFPAGINDNVQSIALQGHEGVLSECSTCHVQTPPTSTAAQYTGGPHGLHPMTATWGRSTHRSSSRRTGCTNCHGSDWRGTVLSEMQGTRTMETDGNPENRSFWRGFRIGCWSCHNGMSGEDGPPATPTVTVSPTAVPQASIPFILNFITTPSTATVRIVKQPAHGTVALNGKVAVYYPAPGYSGTDSFTFAARESTNSVDSNLGTVSVAAANYLLWKGDGISNQWNTTTSGNWLQNGNTPTLYSNGTPVTLGDTGSTSPNINLTAALTPGSLAVNSAKDYTLGGTGSLAGAMSLTKYGGGTLTLGNNHTFTGTTTIQGGTIKAGALAVTAGASSLGNATSAVTLGGTLGKGSLVYTGNSANYTRGFTIGSGGGQLDATVAGQTLALGTGNITAGGPLTFGGNGNIQVNSVISGSGSLTKTGAGRLIINNTQTFTGAVAIHEGSVKMSGGRLFAANTNLSIAANAVWLLDGSSQTLNTLTGLGTVSEEYANAGTDVLTVGNSGSSFTFAGTLAGGNGTVAGKRAIALTKTGAGTMTLTGNNTHTGTTTISAGTLQVGAGGSSGNLGTGAVVNHASLVFNRSDSGYLSYVVPNAVSGTGTLTKSGAGTIILAGTNSYAGTTTISAGVLQIGAGGSTGTLGSGAVVNNANLTFNRSDAAYVAANAISGTGTLIKTGAGTVTLSGTSTYTGNTTVSEGTLALTGTIHSGSTATVRAAKGGTLRLLNGSITAGSLVVDTGGTLAGHGSLQGNLVNHGTVLADSTGPIVVNGTVTNSGTMRLTSGSLSSTGLFINNGVLDIINGPQALPPNFQNNGTVLDSRSVRISEMTMADSSIVLSVSSVSGHNYQMQRADSLSGPWTGVGPVQAGSGAVLQFTDPAGANGAQKRFYRIQVTP
jgi:autotransporter-associated beta strand protein